MGKKRTAKSRLVKRWIAFGAIVGVLATCIGVWQQSDALQRSLCRKWERLQTVCADSNKRVTDDRADELLALYVGRLTAGGGPGDAWAMLTDSFHNSHDQAAYFDQAKRLFWREVVGRVERVPSTFNAFKLYYRDYVKGVDGSILDGHHQQFSLVATLAYVGDDIMIADLSETTREGPPTNVVFSRPTLQVAENVYRFPRLSSDVSMYTRTPDHDGEIAIGGQLTALCVLQVAAVSTFETAQDVGSWTRVPQGWIRSVALDPQLTTEPCDQSVVNRSY